MSYYREILRIGLPAMAENCLQMFMTLIDAYLAAQISLSAVSAVSLAGNIISVYQAVFIALSAAVSSLAAKHWAQQSQSGLTKVTHQAVLLTLWLSLGLGLLSIFAGRPILELMGAEQEVSQLGGLYLSWVGGSIFLLGLMTCLSAVLRASGRPRQPMYVSLLTNLLNVLLSAFFIFVCDMGVLGAALGTVLSRLVGLILLWHFLAADSRQWSWLVDSELLRLALPTAGERLVMRLGDILVLAFITRLGTKILAGNAIGETLTQFNYLPAISLAAATVILTARYQAQGEKAAVEQVRRQTYLLALAIMAVLAGSVLLLSPFLTSLFTQDTQASSASQLLVLLSFISLPMTAGTLVHTGLWQGLGRPRLPFYATGLGMLFGRIGLGYLLAFVFKLGFLGILIGVSLDNLFRWIFLKVIYHKTYGRNLIHENQ